MTNSVLASLLREFPNFAFDPVDAYWAFETVPYLTARLERFRAHVADADQDSCRDNQSNEATLRDRELLKRPLIDKASVMASPTSFIPRGDRSWFKDTSGTTGRPLRVYYSAEHFFEQRFLDIPKLLLRRDFEIPESTCVFCIHITDSSNITPTFFVSPLAPHHVYANIRLGADMQDMLSKLNPRIISSRPELLEYLANIIAPLDQPPALLVSAGGYLSPQRRALIERESGIPCTSAYALTEVGLVASECRAGSLHVDETSVYVEIVDDDSKRCLHGVAGEIVVSALSEKAPPFLRYRTGDRGILHDEVCGCGRRGPRLDLLQGRVVPLFRTNDNARFSPTCLNDLLQEFPLRDYQVIQQRDLRLDIFVEAIEPYDADALYGAIAEFTRTRLPAGVSFEVHATEFDRFRKRERYIVVDTGPTSTPRNRLGIARVTKFGFDQKAF